MPLAESREVCIQESQQEMSIFIPKILSSSHLILRGWEERGMKSRSHGCRVSVGDDEKFGRGRLATAARCECTASKMARIKCCVYFITV